MKNLKILTTLSLFLLAPILGAQPDVDASGESARSLKAFFTDGCTLFIDGPKDQPALWRHCCVEHDLRYWFGGSQDDRNATDLRLKACVEKVAGANWANLIYYGVKTGQISPIKNKTHWNWGWKEKREYGPLTFDEISAVKLELSYLTVPEVDMSEFIRVNFP